LSRLPNGECTTKLHAAGFVKKPFEHDALDRRQGAQRRLGRCVVIDHLFRASVATPATPVSHASAPASAVGVERSAMVARSRETDCEKLVGAPRRFAEPEWHFGVSPLPSSTRTVRVRRE